MPPNIEVAVPTFAIMSLYCPPTATARQSPSAISRPTEHSSMPGGRCKLPPMPKSPITNRPTSSPLSRPSWMALPKNGRSSTPTTEPGSTPASTSGTPPAEPEPTPETNPTNDPTSSTGYRPGSEPHQLPNGLDLRLVKVVFSSMVLITPAGVRSQAWTQPE